MLWIVLIVLLAGSATVSASETALFGLSRQTVFEFSHSKKRMHHRVMVLLREPRQLLLTLLMTNTAVNVAIFSISFFLFRSLTGMSPTLTAVASLLAPAAVILLGEMLPKATALIRARQMAPMAASLIGPLHAVLAPIRWILGTFVVEPTIRLLSPQTAVHDIVTTDELKLLVDHSAQEGEITSNENEMLHSVITFTDVSVREIMTPRVDIRSIRDSTSNPNVLAIVKAEKRRRLPIIGRDLDDIRGVLYGRDILLSPDVPMAKLMKPAHFVPEQVNLVQLLQNFRNNNIHMAIVVDEFGGTSGLVTMDDILAYVVGILPDSDRTRPVLSEQIDDNTYRVSGNLSARAWADRFGVETFDRSVDTVAGIILARLGRLPKTGDTVHIRNLTLTVERLDRRRIDRVLLTRRPEPTPEEPQS